MNEERSNELKEVAKVHKNEIIQLETDIKNLNKAMSTSSTNVESYYSLIIASKNLDIVNISLNIYDFLSSDPSFKNNADKFLGKARTFFFNMIIALEKIYGSNLSIMDNINSESFSKIEKFHTKRLYNFITKIYGILKKLTDFYSLDKKYKWNVLELKSRFCIILKYMINFRYINNINDKYYSFFMVVVNMYKELLENISDLYRQKYFIVTKKSVDMQIAISFQEELKRFYMILNDREMLETTTKKIDMWRQILLKEETLDKKRKEDK